MFQNLTLTWIAQLVETKLTHATNSHFTHITELLPGKCVFRNEKNIIVEICTILHRPFEKSSIRFGGSATSKIPLSNDTVIFTENASSGMVPFRFYSEFREKLEQTMSILPRETQSFPCLTGAWNVVLFANCASKLNLGWFTWIFWNHNITSIRFRFSQKQDLMHCLISNMIKSMCRISSQVFFPWLTLISSLLLKRKNRTSHQWKEVNQSHRMILQIQETNLLYLFHWSKKLKTQKLWKPSTCFRCYKMSN